MTHEEQEKLVIEIERNMERLQALYNQYFMGIEKIEPTIPRKDIDRKIQMLRKEQIRNTAIRFRFQSQIQKYNTHSTHWRRICRQIEEGTYQRDLNRANARSVRLDEVKIAKEALGELGGAGIDVGQPVLDFSAEMEMDLDDPFALDAKTTNRIEDETRPITIDTSPQSVEPLQGRDPNKTPIPTVGTGIHKLHERLINDAKADPIASKNGRSGNALSSFFSIGDVPPPTRGSNVRTAPPPRRRPTEQRPSDKPSATASPGGTTVNDERMKRIYRTYAAAKKKTNEKAASYEKLTKLLDKQLKNNPDVTDFKIAIRNGKTVIKSVKK